MKRGVAAVLIVVLAVVAGPPAVERALDWRYGAMPATTIKPPDMTPSLGEPFVDGNRAGLSSKSAGRGWIAYDTPSQVAAEYELYLVIHHRLTTPVYLRTGTVDGIQLPPGTTLMEYCGAPGEKCEYWQLVGHRGRGYVEISDATNRERLETIQYLVDAWNRAG
jgi:hypothetical protein